MGARNRVGIGLSFPARLATQPGGIGSLESILGLLKSLTIRALYSIYMRYTIFGLASDVEEMEMKEREDTERRHRKCLFSSPSLKGQCH
jgi:hypothetical protein